MNLPFGKPTSRENTTRRKDNSSEVAAYYGHKLANYIDTLEKYQDCLFEYESRLEMYEKRNMSNQLSAVQASMDLINLKEQGNKIVGILEELKTGQPNKNLLTAIESLATSIFDANYKLDGLDKNVINRLSELILELQNQSSSQSRQYQDEMKSEIDRLKKSVKRGNALIWMLFVMSLFSLSGIVFIVLYIMELIPF